MRTTTINNRMALPMMIAAGMALVGAVALGARHGVRRSEVETQASVGSAGLADINTATGLVSPAVDIHIDGVEVPIVPNAVAQVKTDVGSVTVVNGSSPTSSSTVVTSTQPQSNVNTNLSITTNQSQSNTSIQTYSNSSNSNFVSSNNSTHVFTTGNGAINVTH